MRVPIYSVLLVFLLVGFAVLTPRQGHGRLAARRVAAVCQIAAFDTALKVFKQDVGTYPIGTNGLIELISKGPKTDNWRGPYLEADRGIPSDPWGRPYLYECPGKHNTSGYDISSVGFDSREGTEDDVTNWQQGK